MKSIEWAALLASTLFLLTVSPAQSALPPSPNRGAVSNPIKPTQTTPPNYQTKNDERDTEQHPLFVKTLSSTDRAAEAAQAAKDREEIGTNSRIALWTEISAIVAGLVFAAGLGQIVLFYWQLRLIRKSLDDAKTAAQAAVDANILNREIFVANNRPWLTIENIEFKKHFVLRSSVVESECVVTLRNIGKSPAGEIDVAVKFLFEDGHNASALKQHAGWFNFIIDNVAGFRLHREATVFSMHPTEVVRRACSIESQVIGDLKRARLFCSVVATYRNPGADPWCASARLYKITYKAANFIEDFEFASNLALDPSYIDAAVIDEGNLTT